MLYVDIFQLILHVKTLKSKFVLKEKIFHVYHTVLYVINL